MNLRTQFEHELNQLGGGGTATVDITVGSRQLTCELVERNSLAVAFQTLRVATPELAGTTNTELERLAKRLSERLTYLMEPIRPIEIDSDACVAQLRSSPPQRDDDGRSYYELTVRRGGEIALARYRKEPGTPRAQIAATVTREVLLRLVDDFEAVLGD
jgi:hypothetical protein